MNQNRAMEDEKCSETKRQVVLHMQSSHSWKQATARVGVQMCRSVVYQLLRTVRLCERLSCMMEGMGICLNCALLCANGLRLQTSKPHGASHSARTDLASSSALDTSIWRVPNWV